jgi:hypothetical protein
MYYICVENSAIIATLNYEPNVPESVKVYQVTDSEHASVERGTHYFDVEKGAVVPLSAEMVAKKDDLDASRKRRAYLKETDWQVMRHIREKALGLPTSMTEEAYLALEQNRHEISKKL